MKIKSFFAALLAVLVFSACSNEVDNLPPVDVEIEGQGYLVLNLVNPPTTRTATGGGVTDPGTVGESNIESLTVVLTDEDGKITYVANPVVESLSAKFQITLGGHYVYAIVNCPTEVTFAKDENIHRVIGIAAAAEATSGYKGGSFLMVNKCNSSDEDFGVYTVVTENNSVNNPAVVNIFVDRVACKIFDVTTTPTVAGLPTETNNIVDGVDVVGFVLLNVNKEFNLIQTWSKINDKDDDVLSTPLYPGTGRIAEQYFHNISEYTTLGKNGDNKIISLTDETIGKDNLFVSGPVYTSENRPTIIEVDDNRITSGRGETTGVIYKVQAKKGGSNIGTFYKYNNEVYTELAAIQALPEFDEINLASKSIPERRGLGIKVYEDGVMYYTYFIRDPNTAHQYKEMNYYGVFRNSSYKLAVSNISSTGDDVPGGGVVDPGGEGEPGNPPIDTKEAYISVNVTVNPWILNVISIDF